MEVLKYGNFKMEVILKSIGDFRVKKFQSNVNTYTCFFFQKSEQMYQS